MSKESKCCKACWFSPIANCGNRVALLCFPSDYSSHRVKITLCFGCVNVLHQYYHSPERNCFSGIKKVLTGSRMGVNMNKVHVGGRK